MGLDGREMRCLEESGAFEARNAVWAHRLRAAFVALLAAVVMAGALATPHGRAFADEQTSIVQLVSNAVALKAAEVRAAPLPDASYTEQVGTLMQDELMIGGCELVALGIDLESMGLEADLDTLVSDFLDMNGSFATGYAGDPYGEGAGYAPGIVNAANGYLEHLGSSVRAFDITGATYDDIVGLVSHGYPVLTWTTMWFEEPDFTGMFDGDDEWYSNEHCVVLYGFAEDGSIALISDPLEGYVECDIGQFFNLFEQCGSRAVILHEA